jgi:UDP-N-acetylmuramoyl-L-alanyl-D-glutamate--2,6-diaminopimelate ligase
MGDVFDGVGDGMSKDCGGGIAARGGVKSAVRLSEVLPTPRFIACRDVLGRGVSDDVETCGTGDIFVARERRDRDGHDDVAEAIARGVAGVVAERIVPTFGVPLCLVKDTSDAFARIAHAFHGNPARRMRLIAVTGTSGKTTTAWLVASVLAEAGIAVGVLSDLGCLDADGLAPMRAAADGRLLDDPRLLARALGRIADSGCTHAVVEVSSRMLAARSLAGVVCETVAVTNLATAHLDLHGTRRAYHAIKRRILDCLHPDGCLVVNGDDHRLVRMAERYEGYGLSATLVGEGDITASPVERGLRGQTFLLSHRGSLVPVCVPTPVASFARNAVVAAAIGVRYGLPLERVAKGIEAAGSVSGRIEPLACGQSFAAFLDRPTSRHQLASTLASLRHLSRGRLVVMLGEGVAEGLEVNPADELLEKWCDEVLFVGETRRPEASGAATLGRIGRVLDGLDDDDCLLVLDDAPPFSPNPTDPSGEPMALAFLVEAWMSSHEPTAFPGGINRAA